MFEYHFEIVGDLPGPPKKSYGTNVPWRDRLEPLVRHPGKWAILGRGDKSIHQQCAHLNGGQYTKPPGHWEFAVRTLSGEEARELSVKPGAYLFGRYLGPKIHEYERNGDPVPPEEADPVKYMDERDAEIVRRFESGENAWSLGQEFDISTQRVREIVGAYEEADA